jgi:hypothetical protein
VQDILKILDASKAIGPDLLNPKLLKEAASMLKYPLCRLFNLALTLSTFPSEWKYANVIPVFKKDFPSNLKNYRPISPIALDASSIFNISCTSFSVIVRFQRKIF